MNSIPEWALGTVLAAVIALTAMRARALTAGGALAAWFVGTVAMAAGWDWGILLIAYFVTSSLLSRWRAGDKAARTAGRVEKTGARDAVQVLANGGVFTAAAACFALQPRLAWQVIGLGALAASAADTWATEIGSLAPAGPRSILTWRAVPAGTSGAVSPAGFGASVAAALLLAAAAALLRWPPAALAGAALGGVGGSLVDSLLGASLQARWWCGSCEAETERRVHDCGRPTGFLRGIRWLDNDGVNALATAAGAALALIGVCIA